LRGWGNTLIDALYIIDAVVWEDFRGFHSLPPNSLKGTIRKKPEMPWVARAGSLIEAPLMPGIQYSICY